MHEYECKIFIFDPFLKTTQFVDDVQKFTTFPVGLIPGDTFASATDKRTLSSIYHELKQNIHGFIPVDYLKIDIGFGAWDVIPNVISTGVWRYVRQMGIQIHLDSSESLDKFRYYAKVIKSIEDVGMVRFSSKVEPTTYTYFGQMNMMAYSVYELAWYNPLCYAVGEFS